MAGFNDGVSGQREVLKRDWSSYGKRRSGRLIRPDRRWTRGCSGLNYLISLFCSSPDISADR